MSDNDYRVGPGRPPKDTQFKKGQSGNPKGRPPGSQNLATLLHRELRKPVAIQENGERKTISKLEAIAKQLANQAARGDLRAIDKLSRILQMFEDAERVTAEKEMEGQPEKIPLEWVDAILRVTDATQRKN